MSTSQRDFPNLAMSLVRPRLHISLIHDSVTGNVSLFSTFMYIHDMVRLINGIDVMPSANWVVRGRGENCEMTVTKWMCFVTKRPHNKMTCIHCNFHPSYDIYLSRSNPVFCHLSRVIFKSVNNLSGLYLPSVHFEFEF